MIKRYRYKREKLICQNKKVTRSRAVDVVFNDDSDSDAEASSSRLPSSFR